MPKTSLTGIAVVLSLGAAVAQAQPIGAPVRLLNVALTTQSGDLRASQMIGSTVYDRENRNIGSVKDIVLGQDGRVTGVVVDVGSFLGVGGKYVSVSLNDIKTDNDRLTLNRTKEQLQSAPSYHLDTNGK